MHSCPHCGRRYRQRRVTAPDARQLDLLDWKPPAPRRCAAGRIVLLHHAQDPDGLPRVGLEIPGRRFPLAFSTTAEAFAALATMESPV